ncbi:MAG: hypothetical protein QW476_03305 [Candidatus Bathyarchaeia archaeon]|nr:hypothetical protein [Candidatus Bathyarchaeota archaeon]
MEEQDAVKKLAKLKSFLEKKISELNEEVSNLKMLVEVVDDYLTEKSFKKIEVTKVEETQQPSQVTPQKITPIKTVDGVHLGDLVVENKNLTLNLDPYIKFDVNSPPLKAFLIAKVLEPMSKKDEDAVKSGELNENEAFSYNIEDKDGFVKRILIKNFGDEKRLTELTNAIRWTLRRMYERIYRGL